jgi:hypothetical protein
MIESRQQDSKKLVLPGFKTFVNPKLFRPLIHTYIKGFCVLGIYLPT